MKLEDIFINKGDLPETFYIKSVYYFFHAVYSANIVLVMHLFFPSSVPTFVVIVRYPLVWNPLLFHKRVSQPSTTTRVNEGFLCIEVRIFPASVIEVTTKIGGKLPHGSIAITVNS